MNQFIPIAKQEALKQQEHLQTNNVHNLTNVMRNKSEMGIFSDYPHFYKLRVEGKNTELLYAMRASENGDFVISSQKDVFCMYGTNYVGLLSPNMLGTRFELYDHGLLPDLMKKLPKGFYPVRKVLQTIEYDSNFFAEKPRSFSINLLDKQGKPSLRFENLPPKYNQARGCYTLNFFGRVAKASARNF